MRVHKVLGSSLLAAILVSCAFGQNSTAPSEPQDPTAQAPATQPQGIPPTFPKSDTRTETSSSRKAIASRSQPFTGTVVHEGDSYKLRDGDVEFKLDSSPRVRKLVNQRVKITGTLDQSNSTIHIESVKKFSED
jgi:hypothetical protein